MTGKIVLARSAISLSNQDTIKIILWQEFLYKCEILLYWATFAILKPLKLTCRLKTTTFGFYKRTIFLYKELKKIIDS